MVKLRSKARSLRISASDSAFLRSLHLVSDWPTSTTATTTTNTSTMPRPLLYLCCQPYEYLATHLPSCPDTGVKQFSREAPANGPHDAYASSTVTLDGELTS